MNSDIYVNVPVKELWNALVYMYNDEELQILL